MARTAHLQLERAGYGLLVSPNLVTWFHADPPGQSGEYAQAGGDASSASHYELYLACVDVCLASYRRWNRGRSLLVVNPDADLIISGLRKAYWRQLGVEVLVIPNTHQDRPLGVKWRNQTYLLDVLQAALDATETDKQALVILDSDCVVREDLGPFEKEILEMGRVALRLPYAPEDIVNGLSERDLATLHVAWSGNEAPNPVVYHGGEILAGSWRRLQELHRKAEAAFAWSYGRELVGAQHPLEEAQLLSVADPLPSEALIAQRYIRRIWTQPWKHRDAVVEDEDLAIWHLPAEKKTGIRRLWRSCRDPESWFWTAPDGVWRRKVSAIVGVPRYGATKLAMDAAMLSARRLLIQVAERRARS